MLHKTDINGHLRKRTLNESGNTLPMQISDLFMDGQIEMLMENSSIDDFHLNRYPLVYLRSPEDEFKFLITEVSKKDSNVAFGLVSKKNDLKFQHMNLIELIENYNQHLKADFRFQPNYPIAVYALVADYAGTILSDINGVGIEELFSKFETFENISEKSNLSILKDKLAYMF